MGCCLPWKAMTIVGSLSNLHVLKLKYEAFKGPEWEPIEGKFDQLKYLQLYGLDLKHWRAENIHFSKLRRLVIRNFMSLKKIPFGIGEIPTLDLIELQHYRPSVVTSAEEIQAEQLNMGNDFLRLRIVDFPFLGHAPLQGVLYWGVVETRVGLLLQLWFYVLVDA
ncbi:Hypothetical predicted protein [Olea europaea subsp. europaea]|uniref:Disease resistance protein n=1 Tax=Olea europaea subsp. europaea TaxID=158383 RepID=A0A8S0TYP9_OLEEU|nr:Hypothetical predicted protein [Olea europaea subsp. europaea]